jgi:hypothetical protein
LTKVSNKQTQRIISRYINYLNLKLKDTEITEETEKFFTIFSGLNTSHMKIMKLYKTYFSDMMNKIFGYCSPNQLIQFEDIDFKLFDKKTGKFQ